MTEAEEEEDIPAFLGQCFHSLEAWGMPSAMSVVICGFEMKYRNYFAKTISIQ